MLHRAARWSTRVTAQNAPRFTGGWLAAFAAIFIRIDDLQPNRLTGGQVFVVGLVLAASGLLAPQASILELGGLLGLGTVLAVLRQPALGLQALIGGALLLRFGLTTGTETDINVAVILVAALMGLWMLEMIVRRDVRLQNSGPVTPLLVSSVVALLALLVGLQPWLPFAQTAPVASQIGGCAIYLLSYAAFLLAGHRLREVRWLKALTWLFLAIGAIYIVQRVTSVPVLPSLAPGAGGSMTHLWIVALAFSQGLLNRKLGLAWRGALLGLALLTLYDGFVMHRDWNSGWAPALVGLVAILWLGAPRLALPLTVVAAGALAFQLDLVRQTVLMTEHNEYDILTRTAAWDIIWDIIRSEPILGTGFGNYYWYTPLFSILGWNVRFNSHNNYMDLLAQTGIVGFACFCWTMLTIAQLGWRLRRVVPAGFPRAYVYGALGGLVGTLEAAYQGDWVLPFVYNVGMTGFRSSVLAWIFLGGLVALEHFYPVRFGRPELPSTSEGLRLNHPSTGLS